MTPAEAKGLVVGEYYVRELFISENNTWAFLVKMTGGYKPRPIFKYVGNDKVGYPLTLKSIRHLTPEEKAHTLLGINPFTQETLP